MVIIVELLSYDTDLRDMSSEDLTEPDEVPPTRYI